MSPPTPSLIDFHSDHLVTPLQLLRKIFPPSLRLIFDLEVCSSLRLCDMRERRDKNEEEISIFLDSLIKFSSRTKLAEIPITEGNKKFISARCGHNKW